jgi:hypothetical protein
MYIYGVHTNVLMILDFNSEVFKIIREIKLQKSVMSVSCFSALYNGLSDLTL